MPSNHPFPHWVKIPLRSLTCALRAFLTPATICDSFLTFSLCPLPPDPRPGVRLLCHQCLAHGRCSVRMWWVSTCKRVMHQALGLDFIWVFPYLSLPTDRKSLRPEVPETGSASVSRYSLCGRLTSCLLPAPTTELSQGTRQWKPNDCWSPHLSFKNQNLSTLEPAQRTRSLLHN